MRQNVSYIPLSLEQEWIWFLAKLYGPGLALHERCGVWLDGALDARLLADALEILVRRHELLRVTFIERDGRSEQVIWPEIVPVIRYIDIRGEVPADAETRVQELAREEVGRPFDLGAAPLFRVCIIQTGPERHLLVLTMHCLISDGDRSTGLFVDELFITYDALSHDRQPELPPEFLADEMPYREHVLGRRPSLRDASFEAQLAWWQSELADAPVALDLPLDRPRPATRTFAAGTLERRIDPALICVLRTLAKEEGGAGAELLTVILAGLHAVLHRYSRQSDILVSTFLSGRAQAGLERMIGHARYPAVLRARFAANPSFRELLHQVQRTLETAKEHVDASIDVLAEARSAGRMPLRQVLVIQRESWRGQLAYESLRLTPIDIELPFIAHDLILSIRDAGDIVDWRVEYDRDLFNESTIARLLGHLEVLLRAAAATPDQRVSTLPLLAYSEQQQVLFSWNNTAADFPMDKCVHELVADQVLRAPDAVAMVWEERTFSYRQLGESARRLARRLQRAGVGPGTVVGLCVERSFDMVVALLGIIEAGGAYLPLDPLFPKERLAFMLDASNAPVVVATREAMSSLPACRAEVIAPDDGSEDPLPESPIERRAQPGDLAYLLFTSGSTGKPKGVEITHRSLVNFLSSMAHQPGIGPGDSLLAVTTLAFDIAALELLLPLITGARLWIASRDQVADGVRLAELIELSGATVMQATPVTWRMLLDAGWQGKYPFTILCGGEALSRDLAERLLVRSSALFNLYGPTETTVWSTLKRIEPGDGPITIGRPIQNTQIYVLDPEGQPVPVGVPGEMFIGGAGVARGYRNRPDLTAERFVPNPFCGAPDSRMYRSGDLARFRENGDIEYLGRLDRQVKIRGFRIELGEIEAALLAHPDVRDATVLIRETTPGSSDLVAYVVPEGNHAPKADVLQEFLRQRLPEYMIPGALVALDAFPLTPNKKIDQRALPAPDVARPELVMPRSALEAELCAMFQEVLQTDRVGVHDNFLALGGHSLRATQLIARIRQRFQVDIPLRSLLAQPTVAGLSAFIKPAGTLEKNDGQISKVGRLAHAPLSFAQERLWFLHQIAPQSSAYHYPAFFRLRGALDLRALEQSLRALVLRHEPLRTTISEVEGQPVQSISADMHLQINIEHLHGLPPEDYDAEIQRRINAEAQRPFDLCCGPLFRVGLLALAEDYHVLLLNIHHIATDGWSMSVLYRELGALYDGFAKGVPLALPALPIQYADYAAWQRQQMERGDLQSELAWWSDALAGAPLTLELPADRPRRPSPDFQGGTVPVRIGAACTARLRALAAKEGATPAMVLLAAFSVLLRRYTAQEDFLVGIPYAGRERQELAGLVGMLVNTLVLRCNLAGDPSFCDVIARIRGTSLAAYEHAALPFEQLVMALHPQRDLSRNPLVQVFCAPQVGEVDRPALAGISVEALRFEQAKSNFDLTLYFMEGPDEIAGTLEYSASLFDRSTVERMARHLGMLVESAVSQPDRRISALALLSAGELWQVLAEWNHTAADYQDTKCVHQLVEEQAARAPDAVALRAGAQWLTYGELDRRANQLARRLRMMGVEQEAVVGICTGRSFEMVIGALAVFKAGGAYLPLDPDHPDERLHFMLSDARALAVLTRSDLKHCVSRATIPVICLDTDWPDIGTESGAPMASGTRPRGLAYVIYTSGSTGQPKGVQVEHQSLVNLVRWHNRAFAVSNLDRATLLASPTFDASIWETWPYLCIGACLDIPGENVRYAAAELAQWLSERGITICFVSTAIAEQLLQLPWPAGVPLRYLLTGGDRLRFWPSSGLPFQVVNNYGPTEATVVSTSCALTPHSAIDGALASEPSIGRPIANMRVYILDTHGSPVPVGIPGEVFVGGAGLGRGYLNRPDLTAQCFLPDPFSHEPGARMYRTGDLGRWRADGCIEFLGRMDHQVKIRGFRIEVGEVEAVLLKHPAVLEAAVVAHEDGRGEKSLAAYVSPKEQSPAPRALRDFLRTMLPDYMIPTAFVMMDKLPLNASGKLDRNALPPPAPDMEPEAAGGRAEPATELEIALAAVWCEVLELQEVGVEEPFFELGGHSLLLARVRERIRKQLQLEVDMVELFRFSSIRRLAQHLADRSARAERDQPAEATATMSAVRDDTPAPGGHSGSIAIIGMAGRFPGARDVEALWSLLRNGREAISRFSPDELTAAGLSSNLLEHPGFVPAAGMIEDAASFDVVVFGYSVQDAKLIDPQQRLFLECAWEALEHAGYDPVGCQRAVGVFGGCGSPRYWLERLASSSPLPGSAEEYRLMMANSSDFLATRVAYKLGLQGPALNVQTACSTSLVAVHLACQSLLSGQCDMALAGGASVFSLAPTGYVHEEGGILSPDGHCMPFDARARGTVPASGAAVIVLKRLENAIADGDTIHAVIRGSAINNDGSLKVGFSAPSVEGQAAVIAKAHAAAGIDPETITLVEAHGTGTALGDPIEVAALTQAFRLKTFPETSQRTSKIGYCALGSLKSNVGHLDTAAGVAGLIKAVLALEHELIPASLHFQTPNPALKLEESPFFVAAEAIPWKRGSAPRRAGVSAFGLGGTNAHVVLEEAPQRPLSDRSRPCQLLVLSARNEATLEAATSNLADYLAGEPQWPLADIAFTLQTGRTPFSHRRAVVCHEGSAGAVALRERNPAKVYSGVVKERPKVAFMFPGGGTQRVNMGLELYRHERVYREAFDHCADRFAAELGCDIPQVMFPSEEDREGAAERLLQPSLNMATIFATEYALAQVLLSWGIVPAAVTGHSLGEYSAACLAGVLSLDDAISLVALRGKLCDEMPAGAAIIISLPEHRLWDRLGDSLAIAAVNGPEHCVVSGAPAAVDELADRLQTEGVYVRRLQFAGAPHSALVEPAMPQLAQRARSMRLQAPQMPMISNVTGDWMREADSLDPGYWARHLRQTVRFADGLASLLADPKMILLEVGPGKSLTTLARAQPGATAERLILSTMSYVGSSRGDLEALLYALGQLWCAGVEVAWAGFHGDERRQRVPLPSYPFERTVYMLEPGPSPQGRTSARAPHSSASSAVTGPAPAPVGSRPPETGRSSSQRSGEGSGDAIEAALAAIWKHLLGTETVRPSDNFFDVGGNSLLAVQLRAEIREKLNAMLSIHALVQYPTFGALLQAVRSAGALALATPAAVTSVWSQENAESTMTTLELPAQNQLLLCLQPGDPSRPPLLFVQPIGGTVYTYMGLAQHLGTDWPVYAFRASGLEPGEPIHSDIPTMAERYLQEMLELHPQGPYLLGGFSSGGVIAYEMAWQLMESGRNVPLVWLADSGSTEQYRRLDITQFQDWLQALDGFKEIAPQAWHSLRAAFEHNPTLRDIIIATYTALATYVPPRLRTSLLYIRAQERDTVLDPHPEAWWMDLMDGPVVIASSPGNHLTMLDAPHVTTMARILRRYLEDL